MKYVPDGKRQDPVLYKALMEQRKYKMKHAGNSLQFVSMVVATISHVCIDKAGIKPQHKGIAAQLSPNHASQWSQPCWKCHEATAVPIISCLNSQCASSPQSTNTSTPSRPAPWMKPPGP